MILQTDYIRRIWTGLSTDDWGSVEFNAGDVAYIMDQSECWIYDGSTMHQLPDLGGGGPQLTAIQDVLFKNLYSSTIFVNYIRYIDSYYFYGTNFNMGSGGEKHGYQMLMVDGKLMLTASYTNFVFTYNNIQISEYVQVPLYPSGSVYIYLLTLPADYDNTIPIEINRV